MNGLDLRQIVPIIATILIGLIAGLLFGTGMAIYTARSLPEASWTIRFQLEDALFVKAMPPFFLTTLAALVIASVVSQGAARWFFGTAALLTLGVLVITIGFEIPINRQVQAWTPGAAPANWQMLRDRWLANHLYRTIAGILAFISAVIGLRQG